MYHHGRYSNAGSPLAYSTCLKEVLKNVLNRRSRISVYNLKIVLRENHCLLNASSSMLIRHSDMLCTFRIYKCVYLGITRSVSGVVHSIV